MPDILPSPTALLRAVAAEHPGSVAAFVRLPEEEAGALLKQVLADTNTDDFEDAVGSVAERLRSLTGLDRSETETADILTAEESDRFDAISALALR